MKDFPRRETTITVDDLEFRVVDGLMAPHEVFLACARRCFAEGEWARALALVDTYRSWDDTDPEAIGLVMEIAARGVTDADIPPGVLQAVREERDIFNALPDETRNRPIRPASYIAIHPFEARKAKQEQWVIEEEGPVTTRIVTQGSGSWRECEVIEYDIFTAPDTRYFPENDNRRIPDFDLYGRQEFIMASRSDRVVGVLRLIFSDGSTLGAGMFQTYDHRRELHMFPAMARYLEALDPRQVVDVASMAIDRGERDSQVSKALITRTIQRIWETGRRHALACIDTPFYRKLKSRAFDFQDLGPSTYYWGSPTTACILDTYLIAGTDHAGNADQA